MLRDRSISILGMDDYYKKKCNENSCIRAIHKNSCTVNPSKANRMRFKLTDSQNKALIRMLCDFCPYPTDNKLIKDKLIRVHILNVQSDCIEVD